MQSATFNIPRTLSATATATAPQNFPPQSPPPSTFWILDWAVTVLPPPPSISIPPPVPLSPPFPSPCVAGQVERGRVGGVGGVQGEGQADREGAATCISHPTDIRVSGIRRRQSYR